MPSINSNVEILSSLVSWISYWVLLFSIYFYISICHCLWLCYLFKICCIYTLTALVLWKRYISFSGVDHWTERMNNMTIFYLDVLWFKSQNDSSNFGILFDKQIFRTSIRWQKKKRWSTILTQYFSSIIIVLSQYIFLYRIFV